MIDIVGILVDQALVIFYHGFLEILILFELREIVLIEFIYFGFEITQSFHEALIIFDINLNDILAQIGF